MPQMFIYTTIMTAKSQHNLSSLNYLVNIFEPSSLPKTSPNNENAEYHLKRPISDCFSIYIPLDWAMNGYVSNKLP